MKHDEDTLIREIRQIGLNYMDVSETGSLVITLRDGSTVSVPKTHGYAMYKKDIVEDRVVITDTFLDYAEMLYTFSEMIEKSERVGVDDEAVYFDLGEGSYTTIRSDGKILTVKDGKVSSSIDADIHEYESVKELMLAYLDNSSQK